MAFETDDLVTAAFLSCKGHRPDRTERSGNLILFLFDGLSDREVFGLLSSPDFRLCKSYHLSWRTCRRLIDDTRGNGSGGGRR
jgi:hypothetical protein